jgi:hypothetical protein
MPTSKPGAKAADRKARKKSIARRPAGVAKTSPLKESQGGLTAASWARNAKSGAKTEGPRLRPGAKKASGEMSPEEMRRKGSFLRRHFTTLRGPLVDGQGKPTRLALSAHAWGEAVPKTVAAAKRLAEKGMRLLNRYKKSKTTT